MSERPKSLFHYTTAAGLLGILRESVLWATEARFLNDAQEAVYARDLLVSALHDIENPAALDSTHPAHSFADSFDEVFRRYMSYVEEELGSETLPVYVTCFCESGDLLSQWRAYGSDHGYAIELETDALEATLARIPGYGPSKMLMQVRYGEEEAVSVLSAAVQSVSADTNLGHVGVHAHYMALQLSAMLAGVKNPGFREEREWRLIAAFEAGDIDIAKFRLTPMAIIPYIEIPFPRDAVMSITVGPGRHAVLRKLGVERLVRTLSCDPPVICSDLPLRT
jgi:hypothetical protein